MLCSLSGEEAQEPVVSPKSGCIFEKRLIESYISTTGKDPVSEESLAVEELIGVKSKDPVIVPPKPAAFNSIPTMLAAFQNEWDALVLETFTLRKELHNTKQELSASLYQYDAAVRVAGKALKERDEAREALAELSKTFASSDKENGMEVDEKADTGLAPLEEAPAVEKSESIETSGSTSGDLESRIEPVDTYRDSQLGSPRDDDSEGLRELQRERNTAPRSDAELEDESATVPMPADHAQDILAGQERLFGIHKNLRLTVPGAVSGKFEVHYEVEPHNLSPRVRNYIAVSGHGHIAIYDETSIYLHPEGKHIRKKSRINCVGFTGSSLQLVISCANSLLYVYTMRGATERAIRHRQGEIYWIMPHPCVPMTIGVNRDRWVVFNSNREIHNPGFILTRICAEALHVDGRLLALGTYAGQIVIFDIVNNEKVASINTRYNRVTKIEFAFNGYWLFAASYNDSTKGSVQLFDLRKNTLLHEFPYDGKTEFSIDRSSLVLATIVKGTKHVNISIYNKKEKKWSVDHKQVTLPEPLIQVERSGNVNVPFQSYKPTFAGLSKTALYHFTVESL